MISQLRIFAIRLINLGSFRDTVIRFSTENGIPLSLVLLAGANGSGKTTILETIANVLSILNGSGENLVKKLPKEVYAQVDIILMGQKISLFYGREPADQELCENYIGWEYQNLKLTEKVQSPQLKFSSPEMKLQMSEIQQIEQQPMDRMKKDFCLPCLVYFPHFRVIHPVTGTAVSKEVVSYRWIFRYQECKQFPGSLDAYLVWLDYAKPQIFAEIKDFLNQYALTGKKISHVEREELKVVIQTEHGGKHYLEHLSSGEQNLMVLLLELKKHLIPGSILMIDEVENSLHQAFEYKIGNVLHKLQEDYQLQIIVTSHSETFLKLFGAKNTIVLTGSQR